MGNKNLLEIEMSPTFSGELKFRVEGAEYIATVENGMGDFTRFVVEDINKGNSQGIDLTPTECRAVSNILVATQQLGDVDEDDFAGGLSLLSDNQLSYEVAVNKSVNSLSITVSQGDMTKHEPENSATIPLTGKRCLVLSKMFMAAADSATAESSLHFINVGKRARELRNRPSLKGLLR